MGGGHHQHIGNERNMKETDEEMKYRIQRVETIKHNPNHWHRDFFCACNMYEILGGAPTMAFGVIGAGLSYSYYAAQTRPLNWYANNMRVASRLVFGVGIGLSFGFMKFGDRQVLHNAWVAERLRRRYPESMGLQATDLWKLKGVKAPHEFYRWM